VLDYPSCMSTTYGDAYTYVVGRWVQDGEGKGHAADIKHAWIVTRESKRFIKIPLD